jgi:hypothetical protein
MTDAAPDPAAPRIPKYKAPDFMRKEIELFHRARNATAQLRRYGDNDEPVPAVAPLLPTNAIRSVTEINRNIR